MTNSLFTILNKSQLYLNLTGPERNFCLIKSFLYLVAKINLRSLNFLIRINEYIRAGKYAAGGVLPYIGPVWFLPRFVLRV